MIEKLFRKNYRTTLSGVLLAIITQLPVVLDDKPLTTEGVLFSIGFIVFGYFAKDKNVTGTY